MHPTLIRRILILALTLAPFTFSIGRAGAEPPKVLTSIKPLHSLASGVMEGIGQPTLLVRATASPHTYTLRPSDARAIAQADVLFWIGPGYESFMAKAVRSLPRQSVAMEIAKVEGIVLLPTREGGVWADDGHGHSHGHKHRAPEPERDMHLWLDPRNGQAVVTAMAATLAARDPANAAAYRANAAAVTARLVALDDALAKQLAPIAAKPFIVFHDAYQYLERRYGLTAAGSITVSPDRPPGPRRITELRRTVAERGAACVFSEPQFTSALVETVVEGTGAKAAVLDPLGTAVADGKDAYAGLMQNLANSLTGCLNR